MVHLQNEDRRSVYDPFLGDTYSENIFLLSVLIFSPFPGSFLTPDWVNLHKYIHRPELFLLYRINGNDPLNSPARPENMGNITTSNLGTAASKPTTVVLRLNQAKLNPSPEKTYFIFIFFVVKRGI